MAASSSNEEFIVSTASEKAKEKLCLAEKLKLEGNAFYVKQNYKEAIRQYHRALMFIKGVESDGCDLAGGMGLLGNFLTSQMEKKPKLDPEVLKRNHQLKMDCYNNLSACLLHKDKPDYEKIVFYCQQVIEHSETNHKAHFRLAQALFKLEDYEGALHSCLETLKHMNHQPIDSKVTQLKVLCEDNLSKQNSRQKAMYSKMLGLP